MKHKINSLIKTIGLIVFAFSFLSFVEGKPYLMAAEPIKIGAVLSITGWAGALGTPEKEAIEIIVEKVNREGGILGRPLEVYFEDDQSNPTLSAIAATKLIRDRKVCCVIGSTLTVMCMSMLPIFEREGVLNVSLGAGHEITSPLKKWIYRIPLTDIRLSPLMLKFTVDTLKAGKIALFHSTDASGMMGAKGIMENITKYGASIIIAEKFDPKDTSMIPQLTKIKAAHPDAIILYTSVAPASVIAKNYHQLGMDIPVVASHGVASIEIIKIAGKPIEGKWTIFGGKPTFADNLPLDDPWRKNLYDPFMKILREKYGREHMGFAGNGHDGIVAVIQALKRAGTDDRAALRDAMEKVSFEGLAGEFKYSPSDHDGMIVERSMFPATVKGGAFWPYKWPYKHD